MEEGVLIANKEVSPKKHFSKERLEICKECPLFIRDTQVCNPYLWMHPKTRETSSTQKPEFIKGCGCLISRKVLQAGSHCHLGLW